MNNKTKSSIDGIFRYAKKTIKFDFFNEALIKAAPNKVYRPYQIIRAVMTGMFCGKYTGQDFKKTADQLQDKLNKSRSPCAATMRDVLAEERVHHFLTKQLWSHYQVAKRLRLHNSLPGLKGMELATVDAIDIGEIHKGTESCDLCLTRMKDGIPYHFHKIVVLSLCTPRGPNPLAFRFVYPADVKHLDLKNISAEKFKSECELTSTKELLKDCAEMNNGVLPFQLLSNDALFANAPYMELVESYGVGVISIFKQSNRKLFQEALKDFSDQGFGFNIESNSWVDKKLGRKYSSKSAVYNDNNRKEENKSVKIIKVVRSEEGKKDQEVTFMTSNLESITSKIAEIARFERWSQHENKIFNTLTNGQKQAKHIPFHKPGAMLSIVALMLICLGIRNLYTNGNLRRGGRKFVDTLADFFEHNSNSLAIIRLKKLIDLFYHPPPTYQL